MTLKCSTPNALFLQSRRYVTLLIPTPTLSQFHFPLDSVLFQLSGPLRWKKAFSELDRSQTTKTSKRTDKHIPRDSGPCLPHSYVHTKASAQASRMHIMKPSHYGSQMKPLYRLPETVAKPEGLRNRFFRNYLRLTSGCGPIHASINNRKKHRKKKNMRRTATGAGPRKASCVNGIPAYPI